MKKYIFFLMLFLGMLNSYSQSIAVKGKVQDNKGNALSGANIHVKGTNSNSSSIRDGSFSIKANLGEILEISYIGYENKEIKVTSAYLNVILSDGSQTLKEVTVTGSLGVKRSKASLGYATQTVKGDDIAETQRDNFVTGMQGRVAGMTVTSTSGSPGASATIQLRGINSLSGNSSPLFIVDGLPINNSTLDQKNLVSGGVNRDTDYNNRAADINPEDIESITVLKGPEAAALYGILAGNGAIVITTKKGKKGEGSITFTTDLRTENVYRFPKVQQTYNRGAEGVTDAVNYRRFFGAPYAPGTKFYDNIGNFFQTGVKRNNALTFDGGNETTTYRLSLARLDETGVIPTTGYKKTNISINGTSKINDKLRSEGTFIYANSETDKVTKGSGGPLLGLLSFPNDIDAQDYLTTDKTRKKLIKGDFDIDVDNPYFAINKNKANDKNNRFIGNFSLTYDPLKWLSITGKMGVDVNTTQGYRSIHPESSQTTGVASGTGTSVLGYYEKYSDLTRNFNYLGFATAKKTFGKFNTLVRLGISRADDYYEILSTSGQKFYLTDEVSINNTTTKNAQERIKKKLLIGGFYEATFDYNKMLFLNLTGRYDKTSTLPLKNNSFFYPSVSTSFVFTELPSIKDQQILSFGKIRLSYAIAANDAQPYNIKSVFEPKNTTGGGYGYGFYMGNPNLKPEKAYATEIGTELRFFKNRLGIDAAVYERRTENLIVDGMRRSYGTGFILSTLNVGTLKNRGLEITLTGTPIQGESFSWDVMANFNKTDSKLLELPANLTEYYNSDTWIYNVRGGVHVGSPLTTFTGDTYLRNDQGQVLINPSTGQALVDQNWKIIGDRNPKFTLGLQNSFSYKNLKLSFLLDFRYGGDVYNGTEAYLSYIGASTKTLDRVKAVVINGVLKDGKENTNNPTPNNVRITPYNQNDYYRSSIIYSDFVEKNINWMRMRDITLSYKMPTDILKKSTIFKSITINLTATDVFMITNYTGADPAVNGLNASVGGAGGVGYDYGVLSTPRGINLGLKFGL